MGSGQGPGAGFGPGGPGGEERGPGVFAPAPKEIEPDEFAVEVFEPDFEVPLEEELEEPIF
jgi:hypothetical protein